MIICRINVNVGISSPWHTGSLCHTFLDHKDMSLYVTKIIRNIHCNHNDINNLVVYLFLFNNLVELVDRCLMFVSASSRGYKYLLANWGCASRNISVSSMLLATALAVLLRTFTTVFKPIFYNRSQWYGMALKPLIILMFVNYRHYKEILVSLCPLD